MMRTFGVALTGFLVLDGLWLGVVMGTFYRDQLWSLARTSGDRLAPVWSVAALVYVLLAAGVTALVVPRAESALQAVGLGALFGLVVYGVYDLTNLATLRDWRVTLTMVDIAWGTCACAVVAWAAWTTR